MNEKEVEHEKERLVDKTPSEVKLLREFIQTITLSEKISGRYLILKIAKSRSSRFLMVYDHRKESVEKVEEHGLFFDIETSFKKIPERSELIKTLNKQGLISIRRKIATDQKTSPPYILIQDNEKRAAEELPYFFPIQIFSNIIDVLDLAEKQKVSNRILAIQFRKKYWSIVKIIGERIELKEIQFGFIPLRY